MSARVTIHIDMDAPCPQCRKKGARIINGKPAECLKCIVTNLKAGKYDHILKPKAAK